MRRAFPHDLNSFTAIDSASALALDRPIIAAPGGEADAAPLAAEEPCLDRSSQRPFGAARVKTGFCCFTA